MEHARRVRDYALGFPEATYVEVEAWDNQPTYRVRNKVFLFANASASVLTLKLSRDEAAAVVASTEEAQAASYGLGRHGWITVRLSDSDAVNLTDDQWCEVQEWIETSYCLVAPKAVLAQLDRRSSASPPSQGVRTGEGREAGG